VKLIDLRDVYKIYNEGFENEVRALDGVSLSAERGEFLAIIGASGSGKSTLMNILGCLDIPTYGEYFLNGQDVSELSDAKLSKIRSRDIGFVFQSFNLIGSLNAYENVELPLIYQGIHLSKRHDLVMQALERVGLCDRIKNKPSEMSGGQQQRGAIARAIATNPAVIMADEPTGALDTKTGEAIIDILKELNRDGATIILITHNTDIAEASRRIVRISDGRITEDRVREGAPV
jgi:putative ABC transport system ATP-binding protein